MICYICDIYNDNYIAITCYICYICYIYDDNYIAIIC